MAGMRFRANSKELAAESQRIYFVKSLESTHKVLLLVDSTREAKRGCPSGAQLGAVRGEGDGVTLISELEKRFEDPLLACIPRIDHLPGVVFVVFVFGRARGATISVLIRNMRTHGSIGSAVRCEEKACLGS
jgi:hypothetical protein